MPMGLLLPYYALYLGEVAGLSNVEIGAVFAVIPVVGLFAQPAWGLVADRSGQRGLVLVALNVGSAFAYLALWRSEGFAQILGATACAALFLRALMPIAISVTLPALGDRPAVFGRVRACGTLGFLAAVLAFPPIAAGRGGAADAAGLHLMFPASAGCALLAACAAFALPRAGAAVARASRGEWRTLLHNRPFVRLLAISFLAFVFLNGPMEFFPRLIFSRGGDATAVSHLWVLMLLPEIALLLGFRNADRIGARWLLTIGVAAGGMRWAFTAYFEAMLWLFAAQALHAVVVVGLMLGAPLYIHKNVPARLQSTAQSLHGATAIGVGGALSSLGAGWLIDSAGIAAPFWVGGLGALLLAFALPVWLPREARPAPEARDGALAMQTKRSAAP